MVTGMVKGWVGLCGGMVTQLFVGFWGFVPNETPQTLDFCLMTGIAVLIATQVSARFLYLHPEEARGDKKETRLRVRFGYGILLTMGVAVLSSALLEKTSAPTQVLQALAGLIVLTWVSPALLAWPRLFSVCCSGDRGEGGEEQKRLLAFGSGSHNENVAKVAAATAANQGKTLWEMLSTLEFWLLLYSCVTCIGCGIGFTATADQVWPSHIS